MLAKASNVMRIEITTAREALWCGNCVAGYAAKCGVRVKGSADLSYLQEGAVCERCTALLVRPGDQAPILNRAPLTVHEELMIALWAQNWFQARIYDLNIDQDDLPNEQVEAWIDAQRSLILYLIGQGTLSISYRNSLHIHTYIDDLDAYYTCVRCYAD